MSCNVAVVVWKWLNADPSAHGLRYTERERGVGTQREERERQSEWETQ